MAVVDGQLFNSYSGSTTDDNKVKQCLMFMPIVAFGISADTQVIVSTYRYQPIAFKDLPFKGCRILMMTVAISSLCLTIAAYIFTFFTSGGLNDSPEMRKWQFSIIIAKAVTISPFLGLEFYDTVFEHIYHDV